MIVDNQGVSLHVDVAGTSGPAVVLLHGFPENRSSWRHQVGPLAAAGYTVLTPDLRGYGDSDAPRAVEAYAPDRLVSDVARIILETGRNRAHVVGHDWGGVIAWWLAAQHPELVDRLVILNAPHPRIFRKHLLRSHQVLRSWYAAFFQLPVVPETLLRARDFRAIRRLLRATPARRAAFSERDIDGYVAALSRPGRLTGALNYYRAALRHGARAPHPVRTSAPTLILWGERDRALSPQLLEGVERYAPAVHIERFADVGHWIQNEAPAEVNRLLLRFLSGG